MRLAYKHCSFVIWDLQNEKYDHLHSPPSEVEDVRIVVISFKNIAKKVILYFLLEHFFYLLAFLFYFNVYQEKYYIYFNVFEEKTWEKVLLARCWYEITLRQTIYGPVFTSIFSFFAKDYSIFSLLFNRCFLLFALIWEKFAPYWLYSKKCKLFYFYITIWQKKKYIYLPPPTPKKVKIKGKKPLNLIRSRLTFFFLPKK